MPLRPALEHVEPYRPQRPMHELQRELGDLAEEGATFDEGRPGAARYVVRIKAGTVRWVEGGPDLPPELPRTQLLALRLDRLLCR